MAVKFLNGIDVDGSMNIAASDVPNLDASKITSGTLSANRIPDLSGTYQPAGDYLTLETAETSFQPIGNYLTSTSALDANRISSGTLDGARMPWNTNDGFTGTYSIVWRATNDLYTSSWLQVRGTDDALLTRKIVAGDNPIEARSIGFADAGLLFQDNDSYKCIHPTTMDGTAHSNSISLGWSNNKWKDGYFAGILYANGGNSNEWNAAYDWGNHASAGYLTSLPAHNHDTLYDALGSAAAVNDRIDSEVLPQVTDNATGVGNNRDEITALGSAALLKAGGTMTGGLVASGGISGLTLSNGISGSNFNITGVNELVINDPGEGIRFTSGSSGDITLSIVDDSSDNRLNLSGTGASFSINNATVATQSWVTSQGYLTSIPSTYATDAEVSTAVGAVNERIDTEVFDAINGVAGSIPTNNNQLTNGAGYITSADGGNAQTLDGINSTSFLRSDANDTATGLLVFNGGIQVLSGTGGGQFRLKRNSGSNTGDDVFDMHMDDGNIYFDIDNDNDGDSSGFAFRYKTAGSYSNLLNFSSSSITYKGNSLATTSYVDTAVSNLVASAPGALNTLNELAAALGDDANFSTTVTNNIAAVDARIDNEVFPALGDIQTAVDAAQATADSKLGATAKAADSNLLDGINSTSFLRSDQNDTMSGVLTITGNNGVSKLRLEGTTPTIDLDDADGDSFYIHVNSNNFYVLTDRDGGGNYGNWETPHPLSLEADTNSTYLWGNKVGTAAYQNTSAFDSAGSAAAVSTALNERIDTEVFGAIGDVAGTIPTNNNQLTNGAGYITSADGGNADTVDGYQASQLWRRTGATNATVGGGWVTVAHAGQGGRWSGEVIVTDGESGDHSFIRIHWMRSYQDSNFTVLNCGGHANRITGARVLYQTSDNTYGWKYLQVYVTTSSNYYVRITQEGDTPNFSTITAVTPVVENTKSGYAVHGSELTGLENASLAAEEGIKVGGTVYTNSHGDSSQWNTAYGWGNHASAGYLTSIPSDYVRQGQDIVSGNIHPVGDREQLLGLDSNRWQVVFCEILDSAGQHEKNLQNPAGETSVADYATGTVMVWENGKNVPCNTYANHMRMGIAVENVDSPMIQGAEPVLVTGSVSEGDYLVTSTTTGHAIAVSRDTVKQEQLWDCVIGKALEDGEGESHLIKTWVTI
jgi:hypothetical protein